MKNLYTLVFLCFAVGFMNAQTPYERVYTILNSKCQNASCHSATATDASAGLRFDLSDTALYTEIYNVPSSLYPNTASAKFEELIKPEHPYTSFLLRKVAGAAFDTDLALDSTGEGALMTDTAGNPLSNKEIEFLRQWIMFGAKQVNSYPMPNWQYVSDYYDNPVNGFLPKPPKPAPGTGLQFRMGPVFLPASGSLVEQEWLKQQEVHFPVDPEIYEIDGFMNQQSHHFLLFKFDDTTAASNSNAIDDDTMALISLLNLNTSFDGDKSLTGAWQEDNNLYLPQGTGLMWDRKTILDFNFHVKNYNATNVLPCDFYLNIYYRPRQPSTLPMVAALVNNPQLFLPQGTNTVNYDDGSNNDATPSVRYLWAIAGHTHKYGVGFDVYRRDTTGQMTDKIYDGLAVTPYGAGVYQNGTYGFWDYEHPPIEYWDNLLPVDFGKHNGNKSGLVAHATWDVTQTFVTFSYQTSGEMELFYYFYTTRPLDAVSSINDDSKEGIYFQVMPNPMNDNGTLVYTLDKDAKVSASIVDVTGKEVALLNPENEEQGVHQITIGNNGKLSPGMYFAKLTVNDAVYTKKFIVTE